MKDADHPFFRPLWRRVVVVVVCLSWAGLEFYNGSQTWGLIALAFAAYGAWQYLWLYKPPGDQPSDPSLPKE
ncbi:MAG: DUF3329 domain-containing protein [Mesorhizobium sp.]